MGEERGLELTSGRMFNCLRKQLYNFNYIELILIDFIEFFWSFRWCWTIIFYDLDQREFRNIFIIFFFFSQRFPHLSSGNLAESGDSGRFRSIHARSDSIPENLFHKLYWIEEAWSNRFWIITVTGKDPELWAI